MTTTAPAHPPHLRAKPDPKSRAALRLARGLHRQTAFDPDRGAETDPGPSCTSDADIDAFRAEFSSSHYHPAGTCKMGAGDQAVVDPQLKVHGMNGLRVVDASIMPLLVGANTNAPTIMIAEGAANLISGN